jgi:hypothetical protein
LNDHCADATRATSDECDATFEGEEIFHPQHTTGVERLRARRKVEPCQATDFSKG